MCKSFIRTALIISMCANISLYALPLNLVFADDICGPGKHVGSEQDGPGMSFQCAPDRQAPSVVYTPNNDLNNVATGLTAASALLNIASIFASRLQETDNTGQARLDTQGFGTKSRTQNREALLEMQKGHFSKAKALFLSAAVNSERAMNPREAEINRRNASIAGIEDLLSQIDLKSNKPFTLRDRLKINLAFSDALAVDDVDLQKKIKALNDRLNEQAKKSGQLNNVKSFDKHCSDVNGELICK